MNRKTIIIAGSGRSGTTWVQDSLAEANNLRTVFEPLHPVGVPAAQEFAFKYQPADTSDPDLKRFMDEVLQGRFRSLWANYRIRPDRFNLFRVGVSQALFNVRKLARHYRKYRMEEEKGLVVKFIRANLMLPWLVRQYHVPTLFVVRHPCAVIASRLKLGGKDWARQSGLDRYRADSALAELIQGEFGVDIAESFSPVAESACVWCVENLLPIRWAGDAGYTVTAYENLLARPADEWGRVIRGLGLSHTPGSSLLAAPSQQVSPEMRGKAFSDSHLGKWRQVLTPAQVEEVSLILGRFSCPVYSVDKNLPMEIQS